MSISKFQEIIDNDYDLSINKYKQAEMETELTEREQLIYGMISENQKISIDDIATKLDITRRTALRDVQEIMKKCF